MDDLSWDEEIVFKKYVPVPELPEDKLMLLLKKNPLLEKLIIAYDLKLEM